MAKSALRDKTIQPDAGLLKACMGPAYACWQELDACLLGAAGATGGWKHYGAAWGWCLVCKRKKATLAYLTPGEGCLYLSMSYSEKGRALARQAGLSPEILALVEAGKDNAAGRVFDLRVGGEEDVAMAKQLVEIKLRG